MLEELVFYAGLEVGAAVVAEIEGLEGELQLVVQGKVVDPDAAGRFEKPAPEDEIPITLADLER